MGIDRLPSGSYRVRKMCKGKNYTLVFDHKPSDREITIRLADMMQDEPHGKGSFDSFAREYIDNRRAVISPATIRTYNIKLNQLSVWFRSKDLYDISSQDVQKEINDFSASHAPKTVKTLHGFISSVLAAYRPNLALRTKLPQNIATEKYEPSNRDIKRILEEVKGTDYSIPFQLGVLGCRRGEICALSIDDLKGNELWIHRSMVYLDGKWIIKETPKTEASNRILNLPDALAREITAKGYIYNNHPNALNKAIHRIQDKLGIPSFKFHTLRSYFASYAHSLGIPDVDIMSIGGWKSDSIMKSVYRKSIEESKKKSMNIITDNLLS